jgi:hypothetical protein
MLPIRPWSQKIAELVVDALLKAKIVDKVEFERAVAIAEEEIRVRLLMHDRPDPDSY